MDLKIKAVHNHGDAAEEYVLLEVTDDCNLEFYMICDTTYASPGYISNRLRHTFWFYAKEVKKGDLVIVRTAVGKDSTFTNTAGDTVHRFYWGLRSAVWNNTGDAAVLMNICEWNTTKAR